MRAWEDQQGSARLDITLDINTTRPAANTQSSSMTHAMDIQEMLNSSEMNTDSAFNPGSGSKKKKDDKEDDDCEDVRPNE